MAGQAVFKTGLELVYYSGAARALRPVFGGRGAIFMLHHVRPATPRASRFAPNAVLDITPDFLDMALTLAVRRGFELIGMDEVAARLRGAPRAQPFIAVTLDDAYRDNLVHALPVFQRHRCPFTIYVAGAITDGRSELWWDGLELAMANNPRIEGRLDGRDFAFDTATDQGREAAWNDLYWRVRRMPQHAQRTWIREFCSGYGIDLDAHCRAEAMSWDEVRKIAADPLCTIGAHTINHFAVRCLEPAEALREMRESAARIERETGKRPRHFAYPYGDTDSAAARDFRLAGEAGFETAVTTRKGMLFGEHADHLHALPRLSLSGNFQKLRYVDALLSGAPFALFNRFRKLNVA